MRLASIVGNPWRWLKGVRPHRSLLLLFISGFPSCSDSHPLLQPEPIAARAPEDFDARLLKSLAKKSIEPGARIAILAPSGAADSLKGENVVVGDTNVLSIDGAGVLHAMTTGSSWVGWSTSHTRDSVEVHVADPTQTGSLQDDWTMPAAPLKTVDVRYPTGRSRGAVGKSWRVAAGGDLQGAFDGAQPGDEIVLASDAVFTGNFTLPNKQSADGDWIIVRAETMQAAAGSRMTPELALHAAKVMTPNSVAAIATARGAHKWRLVGFEVAHQPTNGDLNYGIVVLGNGAEPTLADQPADIVLDRMYVHGSTTASNRRCVAFNGRSLAVVDSWLGECHAKGYDAQGVCGWSGAGPFLIENNHIEASGQAIMFGGADPTITDVSPSDITIRHNYLFKPLDWGNNKWTVKATFELKHGRRVLFEGNVLENHWIDSQTGFAILFQTLADDNRSWNWTTVQDVMVRNNIIKNSTSGANVLARVAYNGGVLPTNPSSRIVFENNLWQDVGRDPITGTPGRIFQLLSDLHDVTLVRNSITLNGSAVYAIIFDGDPEVRTTIMNNIFPGSQYGITGSGAGQGAAAMSAFAPGGVLSGNVLPAQPGHIYPANNFFRMAEPRLAHRRKVPVARVVQFKHGPLNRGCHQQSAPTATLSPWLHETSPSPINDDVSLGRGLRL